MSQSTSPIQAGPLKSLLVASAVAVLILLTVAAVKSWHELEVARARQALLEEKIDDAVQGNNRLAERIRRLQEDPAALERVAREQLGLVRPGEVVIVLPGARRVSSVADSTEPAKVEEAVPNGPEG